MWVNPEYERISLRKSNFWARRKLLRDRNTLWNRTEPGFRVLHHLNTIMPDSKNTILLTGFQAEGTRGASLLEGEKCLKIHGADIPVRAEVAMIENLSAHADQKEILDWLSKIQKRPKQIFITHGEKEASAKLKEAIQSRFGWDCLIPEYLQTVNLS